MTSIAAWNSIEGLPKQFVASLRVLFDILDEGNCGYVRLTDIETRWHEEGVKGLPSGVTDALRKVTPPNGYLSFDRFVAGLKLALLTSQNRVQNQQNSAKNDNRDQNIPKSQSSNSQREPAKSQRDPNTNPKKWAHHTVNSNLANKGQSSNTAAVRPNNVLGHTNHRHSTAPRDTNYTESIPNTKTDHEKNADEKFIHGEKSRDFIVPPPRPERPSPQKMNSESQLPPKVPPRDKSKIIISELKNWQRRVNSDLNRQPTKENKLVTASSDSKLLDRKYEPKGNNTYENIEQFHKARKDSGQSALRAKSPPPQRSATVKRRDSARRHTLANGVDYNMIKRMKQLEQEKDALLKGLEILEQAREWYHKQVLVVEDKQKYVGKTSYNDYNLEANQERMNFQYARIMEVNQQLRTLMESSEKGFPLHMNLAVSTAGKMNVDDDSVKLMKDQNRQLSKTVNEQTDKITQLEKEKATLIRDLFEARAQNKNYDDTTFM